MSKWIVFGCSIFFVFSITITAHAQDHDIVWVWNAKCQSPTMIAVRVQLDGRTVYHSSIPTCQWERRFEIGKASFTFTPHRPIVWYGYRSDPGDSTKDPGDKTPTNATFEIDLWQAGGESDVIELGFSAAARDGLHMNSIHLLSPKKLSKTTMAPGLVLETWPESNGGKNLHSHKS